MTVNQGMLVSTELNIYLLPNSVTKRGSAKGDPIWKLEARNLGKQKPNYLVEESILGIEEASREAEPEGLVRVI